MPELITGDHCFRSNWWCQAKKFRGVQSQALLNVAEICRDGRKRDAQKPSCASSCNLKRIELPRLGFPQNTADGSAQGGWSLAPQNHCPHFAVDIEEVPLGFLDFSPEAVAIAVSDRSPAGDERLGFDDQ